MRTKRLIICLAGGVISAVFCILGSQAFFNPPLEIDSSLIARTGANRVLLGFIIAISNLKMNYLLHGALIGLVVSLSVSIGFMQADFYRFVLYTGGGILYGILIEYTATKLFKAPIS